MNLTDEKKSIGIIGLGIMGGSFAKAIKKFTLHTVFGTDIDASIVEAAISSNAIDKRLEKEEMLDIDILILALTPKTAIEYIEKLPKKIKEGAIILDIGGNKREVFSAMERAAKAFPLVNFVAAHPMAGKEDWGFSASSAELFLGAKMLLCPVASNINAIRELEKFFIRLGFISTNLTTASDHDKMIAYTSQAPHAISAVFCLNPLAEKHHNFSAGSFKDLTRVAKLNSPMWAELFIENSDNLCAVLDVFISDLEYLKKAIEQKEEKKVKDILERANKQKTQIDE